jgi:urea transporter
MSGMDEIYGQDNFLKYYEELRPVVIFMDSVFRGIGQVMFANSPLSGIIITIELFIGNWELALYGYLGTCVSTLTAHILGFNYNSIRAGLYGYNGCLTAMGISYFSYSHFPQMIGPVVVMSIFSTVFFTAIGKILVQRLDLSPFTFSFQICTWMWLLGSLKFRYFFIDGTILSPGILSTAMTKPDLSNVSFPGYSVEDNFVGFFASVAQVYFIANPYTGAIILIGVCVCSRVLSFFALFGAVTGQLSAAYLLGLPAKSIHSGLWGYNSVLTCQALGGMFFVLTGCRIWLFTLYGSIMTVIL